jgi:hypothetical protein
MGILYTYTVRIKVILPSSHHLIPLLNIINNVYPWEAMVGVVRYLD